MYIFVKILQYIVYNQGQYFLKSYKAILSDSGMMVMAAIIASYLAGESLNKNIIVLVVSVYVLPYLLYN